MHSVCAFALIAALAVSPAPSPRTVSGVVFADRNGNGIQDPGERPLAGVVVSNQVEVVTTDAAGRFQLAADDRTIVFVSVPTDWRAVGASWQVVAGRDALAFGLRAERQPRSFRFIHASDTHIDTGNVARVRRFSAMADSLQPALILLAGDLIRDAMSQSEERARGYFELFRQEMHPRAPFWAVPGNHDHFGIIPTRSHVPATHPLYDRGMYRAYLGPEYYSFNYGGVHFIGLDTVQPDDSAYYGGVDSLQLAWLARDVATVPSTTPIVLFAHIPLASGIEPFTGYYEAPLVSSVAHLASGPAFRHTGYNTLAVLELFNGRPLPLILGGHTHVAEKLLFQSTRGPVRFEQSAAIVGPNDYGPVVMPSGFSLYAVRNGVIDAGAFVPLTMPTP